MSALPYLSILDGYYSRNISQRQGYEKDAHLEAAVIGTVLIDMMSVGIDGFARVTRWLWWRNRAQSL